MFEVLLLSAALAAEGPDAATLLRNADLPRQSFLHSSMKVRARIDQPDNDPQTGEFDLLIGTEDEQLVVFRDRRNKGRKFLIRGNQTWLIVPGSKKPIAVTPAQRLMGATSYSDLARVRLSSDYQGTVRPGVEPCSEPARPCYVVDITATSISAPYASGTLWIDTSEGLLRRAVYALASGKAVKEIFYRYRDYAGRTEPASMTLIDLLLPDKTGKTTLEFLEHKPAKHPPATFDPQQQVKQ